MMKVIQIDNVSKSHTIDYLNTERWKSRRSMARALLFSKECDTHKAVGFNELLNVPEIASYFISNPESMVKDSIF
jgi:hypothetical protein